MLASKCFPASKHFRTVIKSIHRVGVTAISMTLYIMALIKISDKADVAIMAAGDIISRRALSSSLAFLINEHSLISLRLYE